MGVEEATYFKYVELNAIGKQPFVNLHLRMKKFGVRIPTYKEMHDHEQTFVYPSEQCLNGWRANLCDILTVIAMCVGFVFVSETAAWLEKDTSFFLALHMCQIELTMQYVQSGFGDENECNCSLLIVFTA